MTGFANTIYTDIKFGTSGYPGGNLSIKRELEKFKTPLQSEMQEWKLSESEYKQAIRDALGALLYEYKKSLVENN